MCMALQYIYLYIHSFLTELRNFGTKLEHEILDAAAKRRSDFPAGSAQHPGLKPLSPSLIPSPPTSRYSMIVLLMFAYCYYLDKLCTCNIYCFIFVKLSDTQFNIAKLLLLHIHFMFIFLLLLLQPPCL